MKSEDQQKVSLFCRDNGLVSSIETCYIDLMSEAGELGKEILKGTGYGKTPFVPTDDFEMEVGDLYYSLLTLANGTELDLSAALEKVLKKYNRRMVQGSPGSEND